MTAKLHFFCFFALTTCLGSSHAHAEIFAQQYGATVLVWMDDEAEMNWLKIHQQKSALLIEGYGTVNLFVPIFEVREKFSAHTVQEILVIGSNSADVVVNETFFPMHAYGGAGSDMLVGGYSNDVLHGGDDDDGLFGRDGDDQLYGDGSADILSGGNDNDYLDLGGQWDEQSVQGDAGKDTFVRHVWRTKGGIIPVQVNFHPEAGELDLGVFDLFEGVEPFSWSGDATDFDASQGDSVIVQSLN